MVDHHIPASFGPLPGDLRLGVQHLFREVVHIQTWRWTDKWPGIGQLITRGGSTILTWGRD